MTNPLDYKAGTKCFAGEYPINATSVINDGSLVMLDATGAAIAATDAAGIFVGVCDEGGTGGAADGDVTVKVYTGIFKVATTTTVQAGLGTIMHCENSTTVDDATGGTADVPCGMLVERESATVGWVDLKNSKLLATDT